MTGPGVERGIARAVGESTGTAFLISPQHAVTERRVVGSSTTATLYFLGLEHRFDAVVQELFPEPENLVVLKLAASVDAPPLALGPPEVGQSFHSIGFSTPGGEALAGRLGELVAPCLFALVSPNPLTAPRDGHHGAPAIGPGGVAIGIVGMTQGEWSILSGHRIRELLLLAGVPHRWRDLEAEAAGRSRRRRRILISASAAAGLFLALTSAYLWRHRRDDRIIDHYKGNLTTVAVSTGTVQPADGSLIILQAAGEGTSRTRGAPLHLGPGNAGIIASLPPRLAGVKIDRVWLRTTGPSRCGGEPNGVGLFDPWLNAVHVRGIPTDYGLTAGWHSLEPATELSFIVVRTPAVGASPVDCGFGLETLIVVPSAIAEVSAQEP